MTKPNTETALVTLDGIDRALAEARTFGERKELHALIAGALAYAKAHKLGIEAENYAALRLYRAERGMGEDIVALKEAGLFGPGVGRWASDSTSATTMLTRLVAAFPGNAPRHLNALVRELGGEPRRAAVSTALSDSPLFTNVGPGLWTLDHAAADEWRAQREQIVKLADLHLTPTQSADYQGLAQVPEDEFERRLDLLIRSGARLARTGVYRMGRAKPASRREVQEAIDSDNDYATPESAVFGAFRAATIEMLAGMDRLPEDELRALVPLIRALADKFNEVRAQHGNGGAA